MSENPDEPDFTGEVDEEEETEIEVTEEGEEETQDTTSTESEPTTAETTGRELDEQHQEYLDELVERGDYDSEQEAIEFAIRYSASEKYGV